MFYVVDKFGQVHAEFLSYKEAHSYVWSSGYKGLRIV